MAGTPDAAPEKPVGPESHAALDAHQAAAVGSGARYVRVVAGPGSGKTRVLAARAALAAHRTPGRVLCLTFTRRAARELAERLAGRVSAPRDLRIETLHAFCLRLLRAEVPIPGGLQPGFTLLGGASQRRIVREATDAAGLDRSQYPAAELLGRVSERRTSVPEPAARWGGSGALAKVGRAYEEVLARSNATDFDGLLLETRTLLDTSEDVRERWTERYAEILVDEAQDVSRLEWDVLERLTGDASLFAVGDPDQAIYTWRDGPSEFATLEERFDGLETLHLPRCHRSSANILEAADSLVGYNEHRVPRTLEPTRESGEPLLSLAAEDPDGEAQLACKLVTNAIADGVPPAAIGILTRTHALARPIEAALNRARIPFTVRGGVPFHERREIADVLAYLRLLENPRDEDAFWTAVGAPKRGVGPVGRARLQGFVDEANTDVPWSKRTTLLEAIQSQRVLRLFQGRTRAGLESFASLIEDVGTLRKDAALPVVEAVLVSLEATEWIDAIEAREDGGQRREALEELRTAARAYDERFEGGGVTGFLADMTLASTPDDDAPLAAAEERVELTTLHGAKGAEFDVVVIAGLADDVIPHGRTLAERGDDGLEEERRLLYVGLTRARDQVFLTWPRRRPIGGATWGPARASRFFDELPADLVQRVPAELVDALRVEAGPETLGLSVGDRVEHAHWGPGFVAMFTSRDADPRAIVVFDEHGPRELFLRHTALRRLG